MSSTMGANFHSSSCAREDGGNAPLSSIQVKTVEIMALIFLITYQLVFLAVFGSFRRSSRSFFWKIMLCASYFTSVALIPFILGTIQQAPYKDELLIIWGMLLLIVYSLPDSFSAYSPEDVTQWRMNYIQFLIKFWTLAVLWGKVYLDFNVHLNFTVMGLFTLIVFLKAITRSLAHFFASPSYIEESAKLCEVCMAAGHNPVDERNSDPVTMEGYGYVVAFAGSNNLSLDDVLQVTPSDSTDLSHLLHEKDVVTLENVWKCEEMLLTGSGDTDNRLKDICVSFALLKILFLKSTNYALLVKAQPKARKLITNGLLASKDKDRVFRVIEVELKLLYELIYTKYPLYASPIAAALRLVEFILSFIVCALTVNYVSKHADSLGIVKVVRVRCIPLDVLVTYVLLGMVFLADVAQVWMIFSSEWVKAALIINYAANRYCLNNRFAETIIRIVCKPKIWKPWSRELGQYSLIESPCYGINTLISAVASAIYPRNNRDWQRERKAVHLSEEVKGAVLDSLRDNLPHLESGMGYMRGKAMYARFPGQWKGEHEAEVILVLHIATGYCKIKSKDWGDRSSAWSGNDKNCRITIYLSNYLAYLVAFVPRLLPPPYFEPQFQFRRVMMEARKVFEGCKKEKDKIDKLDMLSKSQDKGIIVRGARLGSQLLEQGNGRWKTLADFWSAMALCAATSGEMRAHLEKLAEGGEFLTHLWALLHHTCIPPTTRPCSCSADSTVEDDRPSRMSGV